MADFVVTPGSIDQLVDTIGFLSRAGLPWLVVGHTSNLLVADEGVRAIVIQLSGSLSRVDIDGTIVRAEAGVWVPRFAHGVASNGLSGLEHIIGIPGTLGGLVCMNGGSLRKAIGEHIVEVECVDRNGHRFKLSQQDCAFGYRKSAIQANQWIVLEATFRLEHGDKKLTRQKMLDIMRDRKRKFPLKQPNCGSVFISDPDLYKRYGPPGAILEKCGLKGRVIGGAEISSCHANFIVNTGGAKAVDILRLITLSRSLASELIGAELACEVRYLCPDGTILPAHEVTL